MRKIFTILTVSFFVSLGLMAQPKKMHIKLGYGLKTGLNFTHFRLNDLRDQPDEHLNTKWRTGFVLGGFVTVPVYKKISIQPEFLYSSMGGDYWTQLQEHVRARYNYFSIPVTLKYNLCKNFALLAGPQFDFLIQGKESTGEGKFKVSDNLKDHDILVTGGIEFWASKHIVFQVRYMRGFNDVDYRSNMVRYYNEGVQGTFGIKF